MSAWLTRFRDLNPHAEFADIAAIGPPHPAQAHFGNIGKFGMRVLSEAGLAYAADVLRRAEQALTPVDDEGELVARGEPLL